MNARSRLGISITVILFLVSTGLTGDRRPCAAKGNGATSDMAENDGSSSRILGDGAPADTATVFSRHVAASPIIDGQIDAVWSATASTRVPLFWGMRSTDHAMDVDLRSMYTDDTISFLAQWSGGAPDTQAEAVRNKITFHWDIPEPAPGAGLVSCLVACHTAFVDRAGRVVYMSSETIPMGHSGALSAAGHWSDGRWCVEWSRKLVHADLFDLQMRELGMPYSFFIKVFAGAASRPDPVSSPCWLVLEGR